MKSAASIPVRAAFVNFWHVLCSAPLITDARYRRSWSEADVQFAFYIPNWKLATTFNNLLSSLVYDAIMENYVEKLHTLWLANYGKSERKGCKLRNQKKNDGARG